MPSDYYRVAASCFEPDPSHAMTERRRCLETHVRQVLKTQRPDLLVLPELVIAHGIGSEEKWGAESLEGATVNLIAAVAAEMEVNICVPIMEGHNGQLYNTAVYVDRSGCIAGLYRKQVPTGSEVRRGVKSGGPVQGTVLLDGLRIGTGICFDLNFPDQIWHWIMEGVDLLTFTSYTSAG